MERESVANSYTESRLRAFRRRAIAVLAGTSLLGALIAGTSQYSLDDGNNAGNERVESFYTTLENNQISAKGVRTGIASSLGLLGGAFFGIVGATSIESKRSSVKMKDLMFRSYNVVLAAEEVAIKESINDYDILADATKIVESAWNKDQ